MDIQLLALPNLAVTIQDAVATVRLNRPDKRNALDGDTIEQFITLFSALPRSGVRAAVLCAANHRPLAYGPNRISAGIGGQSFAPQAGMGFG